MSGIGTGYDYSSTTYSPEGRIYQIEYAHKAVEHSGTGVGLQVKDGVVVGVEKILVSKLLEPGSNTRLFGVDEHTGFAICGALPDGRQIVSRAREEAKAHRDVYGVSMPTRLLAERIASFKHVYTLYSAVRPFGVSSLVAGYDEKGPQLFIVEPNGVLTGYYGYAIGQGQQHAKSSIEKLDLKSMTCRQAIVEIAKILHEAHTEHRDKPFEIELGWICDESDRQFTRVPEELRAEADAIGRQALEESDSDDDD